MNVNMTFENTSKCTKNPLVIIQHNISTSEWDKYDEALLEWYIKTYWGEVKSFDDVPLFIIFFNIKYSDIASKRKFKIFRWNNNSLQKKKNQISIFQQSIEDTCNRLKELKSVKRIDVEQWVDQNIKAVVLDRQKIIRSIFHKQRDAICMAELEVKLKEIIKIYSIKESPLW